MSWVREREIKVRYKRNSEIQKEETVFHREEAGVQWRYRRQVCEGGAMTLTHKQKQISGNEYSDA